MQLIVGLGNPGRRYAATRHNAGFRVVERFADQRGLSLGEQRFEGRFGRGRVGDVDVAILEPRTYMNLSGSPVAEALDGLSIADPSRELLVVSDDTDLSFGRLRIRPGGGAGGHKGLADIIESIGRRDFPRLRFGVGRSPPGVDTADYVLRPFSREEQEQLAERLDEAALAVETILLEGLPVAMNRFNRAPELEEGPGS